MDDDDNKTPIYGYIEGPGMTLRDWFAGQALAGGRLIDAESAYTIADAMIAEREK